MKGFTPTRIKRISNSTQSPALNLAWRFTQYINFGSLHFRPALCRKGLGSRSYITGFTLIELLVVIAITGILGTIVTASVSIARERAIITKSLSFDAYIYRVIGVSILSGWNFEGGTARDNFEGNNHGTVMGATQAEGIKGGAFSLDGVSNLVRFDRSFFSRVPTEFTVTLWANPSRVPPSEDAVLFYSTRNVEFMVGYSTAGKFFTSYKLDPSGWEGVPADKVSAINKWHHVAVEWSPQKVILYVDGAVAGTRVPTGNRFATTPSGNPAFGAFVRPTGTRNYFAGMLDDINLYTEVLPR